jgi:cholesterol oxidase
VTKWDVIVIGSGFGGAILAARLAEKGRRVLILERGRWWDSMSSPGRTAYPRSVSDPWIWNQDQPEKENGWADFRHFRHMSVIQGAAVGGGSLIYANISAEAPQAAFEGGWPPELTFAELKPHTDRVASVMKVAPLPPSQWTNRTQLMKDSAVAIGAAARFQALNLAVSFDAEWRYKADHSSETVAHSKRFVNDYGVEQGTCVHLGDCDIGCPADARNTLDRNYLAIGMKAGLEIRPLHFVNQIAPAPDGYTVRFDELREGIRIPGFESARQVVVAAGSLGSTELLLRCRDQWGTLPGISKRLGFGWCSNGDFLTPAFYPHKVVDPMRGPTITSAINYLDGSDKGLRYWIEDGGFFNLMGARTTENLHPLARAGFANAMIKEFKKELQRLDPLPRIMPWFAQGMDEAAGYMQLRKKWILFGPKRLNLNWPPSGAAAVISATLAKHHELSAATGGVPLPSLAWTLAKALITPHPLGGCCMGSSPENGVVDHRGAVFGYPGLHVVDGSIVPRALGVNPSRTIGGLSERAASLFD